MSVPEISIIAALQDRALFGGLPAFGNLKTWKRWLVFLRATYGLPLDESQQAIFCEHTSLSVYDPPPGGWREVVCIVGRQSGKTRIAALIAAYEAMTAEPEPDGTDLYCLLIAQDFRASLRAVFSYARASFERVPLLERSVSVSRAQTLTLDSGCVVAAYPCRPQAIRGLRARVVVCDELAYYRSSEGYPTDTEMLRACRPTLATTGGRLIILSSPYAQSGALYDLHCRHYGQVSNVLVWQSSAPLMNPTLSKDYLVRMEQDDPEAYRSEVCGEFRAGITQLLDPEALQAVVDLGVRERAFEPGLRYFAFADPASGSGKDSFTVAISHIHYERDVAVLDLVRAWKPPFNPGSVITEASDILKGYGLNEVSGDRYASGFVLEHFTKNAVSYRPSEKTRSDLYLELLPGVNSSRVVLLDDAEMLRELRGLERRRGTSGRDRVDHRSGGHDDRCNSAAGALVVALEAQRRSGASVIDLYSGSIVSGWDSSGREWRDGEPWSGVFGPVYDAKHRPISLPVRYESGKFVGNVINHNTEVKENGSK